jgi:hypothetical protein
LATVCDVLARLAASTSIGEPIGSGLEGGGGIDDVENEETRGTNGGAVGLLEVNDLSAEILEWNAAVSKSFL